MERNTQRVSDSSEAGSECMYDEFLTSLYPFQYTCLYRGLDQAFKDILAKSLSGNFDIHSDAPEERVGSLE